MSRNAKCAYQKLYEKFRMVESGLGELKVMAAGDDMNGAGLYLCVDSVPIARMLTKQDHDATSPDFDKSKEVQDLFEKMTKLDPRTTMDELDELVGEVEGGEFEAMFERACGKETESRLPTG